MDCSYEKIVQCLAGPCFSFRYIAFASRVSTMSNKECFSAPFIGVMIALYRSCLCLHFIKCYNTLGCRKFRKKVKNYEKLREGFFGDKNKLIYFLKKSPNTYHISHSGSDARLVVLEVMSEMPSKRWCQIPAREIGKTWCQISHLGDDVRLLQYEVKSDFCLRD